MIQIGSWMQFQDEEGNWHNSQVTLLNNEGDIFYEQGCPNDVKPIPLTGEILLDNGFTTTNGIYFKGPNNCIITTQESQGDKILGAVSMGALINCLYVHTLQFLYKALYQEELTLNL